MSDSSTSAVVRRETSGALVRDLFALTKPRVTVLVFASAAAGIAIAPGHIGVGQALVSLFGIWLIVAAANALNCWVERDLDGRMSRTRTRPLPAGRLDANVALGFGLALTIAATLLLTLAVNPLTGLLGVLALNLYVCVYTPMKTKRPLALLVGAIPGAMPPLLGATAVTGRVELVGLALFAIQFLWQMPHFLAIATFRRDEYARAGFAVLPAVHGLSRTRVEAVLYALVLLPVSMSLFALGKTGVASLVIAGLASTIYLVASMRPLGTTTRTAGRWARVLFFVSLAYLPIVFGALVLDAV